MGDSSQNDGVGLTFQLIDSSKTEKVDLRGVVWRGGIEIRSSCLEDVSKTLVGKHFVDC